MIGCRDGIRYTSRDRRSLEIESAKLFAGLARIVRDVGIAEDLAQDALVAALERWPESWVPDKPGRVVDGHREASRDRPAAAKSAARS